MATIKEIASECGVSSMTVSNVINKRFHKVSKQTIDRIEQAMKEFNYVPNMQARALKSNKSNIVVLVIPHSLDRDPDKNKSMDNPFYGEFINSVEYNLRKNGYYIMLKFVDENEVYYDSLKLWNADGVIVLGADQRQFDLNLLNADIPFVLVDTYINNTDSYCTVTSDDRKGGELAAKYLLKQGCKRLGVVGTDISINGVSRERYIGFSQHLESRGVLVEEKHIFEGFPTYNYGIKIAKEIYSCNLDGLFAFSDMVALGIIEGYRNIGKSIPKDISIIGFDGLFIGEISNPKLTTIMQNVYQKGKKTVDILLNALKDNKYQKNIVLPVNLVVKESVID